MHPRKDKRFLSSKVYCRSCMLYACAKFITKKPCFSFDFREQNFRDWKATHENHENFPPRNFSAIRYAIARLNPTTVDPP